MDIDSFIQHYRPEWERLEEACSRNGRLAKLSGPQIDELIRLYLRACGHLAEARTRYQDPRLEAYLNRVVGGANAALYGGRVHSWRSTLALFGSKYRAAARRTLPFILISATIVVLVTVGMDVWVAGSHQAQAGLLPPVARAAIRHAGGHRPNLGVDPASLSTFIFFNNVQVTVLSFITGIGLGIGSIYFLVTNAVLLGSLAGAYQAAGKAGVFWPLILPHGLLELSAICIGAGAGLRMGWSIIDPGDRLRSEALVEEGRDAVMVVLGVIPAFLIAALIEGFITPSGVNPVLSISLGVVVAATYNLLIFGPFGRRRPEAGPVPAELEQDDAASGGLGAQPALAGSQPGTSSA
jgi:uncharacterized membrane protein SpoIIM required for sporulation